MSETGHPTEGQCVSAPAAPLWRAVLLAAIVACGVIAIYASPLRGFLSRSGAAELRTWIDSTGSWAPVSFLLVTALGVGFGAPRLIFAAVAGLAFGWLAGAALALLATLVGCLISFAYARRLGRSWVQARGGRRLERINSAFREHGILVNLVIRAAPIGNCHAANLLMALSPISTRDFVVGTALGILPETLIYALFASATVQGSLDQTIARAASGALLLGALGAMHLSLMRRSVVAQRVVSALSKDPS